MTNTSIVKGSHGLPTQLQEWLCPPDGTTRDFATLQVILLGDNKFWASDKNGEIRNDSPTALKQLRRALTFYDGSSPSTHQRHLSRGRDFELDFERPRSSTLPAALSRENSLKGKQLRPLWTHGRAPSADKPRLGPAIPVAVRRRGGSPPIRPRSIDTTFYRELEVLKEQPTPKPNSNTSSSGFTTARHHYGHSGQEKYGVGQIHVPPSMPHRPSYTDSSMQTDPVPTPVTIPNQIREKCTCYLNHRDTQRDSAVSFSLSSRPSESCANSRRPSLDTPITRPNSLYFDESGWDAPTASVTNPIVMGRMQEYFRSATYVLGAALHPQGMG